MEDTNRWAAGGKNVRVHAEASHGKNNLKQKKGGVGGHLEDTNRWVLGGKNVRVHCEASHGKNNLKWKKGGVGGYGGYKQVGSGR